MMEPAPAVGSSVAEAIRSALKSPHARRTRALFEELNPTLLRSPLLDAAPQTPRPAAVLVPILAREPEPTVLFTVRARTMPSHAGEISLPGGTPKADEAFPVSTALREAEEEVGLARAHVDILGELGVHQGGLGYRVTPVVGYLETPPPIVPCQKEVEEPFEVPLSHLANPASHTLIDKSFRGTSYQMYAVPSVDTSGTQRMIWGLTAGILHTLASVVAGDGERKL